MGFTTSDAPTQLDMQLSNLLPQVTKQQVDSYKPGKLPPCCQLHITKISLGTMILATVYHKVKLIGAKRPHDVFTIVLPLQGTDEILS